MKAAHRGLDVQPFQVSGGRICKNATSVCTANWSNFHTKPRCKSQATWFLFQPPVLIRSHKKFLRLNVCERVLNLPSPGGWTGNGKAELSRSVGAQYLGDNQICLLPSEIAGVWVQVPPLLFHRFIVLCHGGGTSVGEDGRRQSHLLLALTKDSCWISSHWKVAACHFPRSQLQGGTKWFLAKGRESALSLSMDVHLRVAACKMDAERKLKIQVNRSALITASSRVQEVQRCSLDFNLSLPRYSSFRVALFPWNKESSSSHKSA